MRMTVYREHGGNQVPPYPRPREGLALAQGDGETGFPHPPTRGKVRAQPLRRGMGKPGFPIPPPGGRVWEGAALAQGDGETSIPPPGGRVWSG